MATGKSGSYTLTGSKAGITAFVSWAEVYDAIKNQSDYVSIGLKIKSSQYIDAYWLNGTITVNGETVVTFNSALGTHCADIQAKNTYYAVQAKGGNKAQPWNSSAIAHNADGSKNVTIAISIKAYTTSGSNGSGWTISDSRSVTLTDIDRDAPTASFNVSSITTNSFNISATASTTCDRWDYSLDGGSTWKNFSTASGTSASVTVSNLSVNTSYNVKVRARRAYNQVYGTSSAKSVKTLGHATVHSCADFYADASTVKVTPSVTVYEASFKYYVTLKNGSTNIFTTSALTWTAGKATRTVTLTAAQRTSLLAAMEKVKSLSVTLVVDTYSGTTLVGTTSCSVTANTSAANSAPTFTGFTYLDSSVHAEVTGNDQVLIQNYSSLKVTAEAATAKNGATIASYTATIANKTAKSSGTTIAVGSVESSGELELTVSAIDSRGWSTSVKKKVKVLDYAPPKLTRITLRRANGIDAMIQMSFYATMSVIKPDGETDVNSLVNASYRYKLTSAGDDISDYSDTTPITSEVVRSSSGTLLTFQTNELISLDAKKSYDFRLVIKDKVASSVTYHVLPKGIPLLALRKEKVGINHPDPQYELDIDGSINLTGDIYINGVKLAEVLGLE